MRPQYILDTKRVPAVYNERGQQVKPYAVQPIGRGRMVMWFQCDDRIDRWRLFTWCASNGYQLKTAKRDPDSLWLYRVVYVERAS